jgi:hypothetical protein
VQRSLPNVDPLPPMKAEISFLTPFGTGLSQHGNATT